MPERYYRHSSRLMNQVVARSAILIAAACLLQPGRLALAASGTETDRQLSPQQLQQVRSLLSNRCFACHGPDAEQRQGGFRIDQGETIYQQADSEKIPVVPGHPEQSELLRRLSASDAEERMPPVDFGAPLRSEEIALIKEWIVAGAPPLKHWSFVTPTRPSPPELAALEVHDNRIELAPEQLSAWLASPIDRFVLSAQLRHGLSPSPPAPRDVLLRRLALDITGLPPSMELLEAFVSDQRPDATERVVDRLLASPEYGEHWARKWLDLARYADSAGYADDPPRTIWAYRDWVIRALNSDMPLDDFTRAQLAGDLLPKPTEDDLIATAFHRNTLTNNEGGTNDEEFRTVAIVDRVNTTMAVWMGVTFACAQCHTHKYDPFTQEEYFKIYAVFNQSQDADRRDESPLLEVFTTEQQLERKTWHAREAELREQLKQVSPEIRAQFDDWSKASTAPQWQTLQPESFKAKTNTEATWSQSGVIRVKPMQDKIVADTFSLQLDIRADVSGRSVRAIGLRTKPDKTLPGGGAGFGGGNFVLTEVRASLAAGDSNARQARWVRLDLPGKEKILSLAEVQVFSGNTNVAPKGKASQSSTDYEGDAARAIDGKTIGKFDKNTTTHTAKSSDPWWEVDLGSAQAIDRVVIWNRTDPGIHTRLSGLRVSLLDENRQPVFEETIDTAPKESRTLDLSGAAPIQLVAAYADYAQPDFDAAHTVDNDKASGWAVSGQIDREHFLTLIPSAPIDASKGSKLRLELAHESAHRDHLLGSFEIVASYDSAAADWAQMTDEQRAVAQKPAAQRTPAEQKALLEFFAEHLAPASEPLREELEKLEKQLASLKPETSVPVMRDRPADQRRETYVQLRGNYKSLGAKVEPGLPKVFHPGPAGEGLDRLQLANWLVSRDNPLTARVFANRTWEALFGLGIVRTSEEFGSQGELPSHPELLDWLATELIDLQWDSKRLLRALVLSQTYQQTSEVHPASLAADADNVWLARGPRVRLTAEMVRDQALATSGLLSHKRFGPPVRPPQPALGLSAAFGSKTDWESSQGEDRYRRGLYTTWRRSNPYPSMATFDAPSREVCTLRRDTTNTPLQALVTLNDPGFVEAAQALARRVVLVDVADGSDTVRIQYAFRACTSRPADQRELAALERLLNEAKSQLAQQPEEAKKLATEPIGSLPEGASAVELAAWTAVCNVLLNLDEVLMKR